MGLITIIDNNNKVKNIPYIRGTDGQEAYDLALDNGFFGSQAIFNKNLAGMDNPYYPIGAVYLSTSSTSPATLFGGTWERIEDKFIVPAGGSYAALGETGGSATVKLTVAQLPEHRHYETHGRNNTGSKCVYTPYMKNDTTVKTESTGGGKAHNNMPPYTLVYGWKRTA